MRKFLSQSLVYVVFQYRQNGKIALNTPLLLGLRSSTWRLKKKIRAHGNACWISSRHTVKGTAVNFLLRLIVLLCWLNLLPGILVYGFTNLLGNSKAQPVKRKSKIVRTCLWLCFWGDRARQPLQTLIIVFLLRTGMIEAQI